MKRRLKKDTDGAIVDMTPMLDIVFIMLIFFIVSAVFLDEQGLSLAETPDNSETKDITPAILVQLDAMDRVFVEGRSVELISVPSRIQAIRAQAPQSSVSLQAEAATSLDAVIFVKDRMDAAQVPVTIKVDR